MVGRAGDEGSPLNATDPDGTVANFIVGAIVGLVAGVATEIATEGAKNLLEGKGVFENLNIVDIGISAGIGAVTGATGTGLVSQGKKAIEAFKVMDTAGKALNARKAAMAAGKIRNAADTARVAAKYSAADKAILESVGTVAGVAAAKEIAKATAGTAVPSTTHPSGTQTSSNSRPNNGR